MKVEFVKALGLTLGSVAAVLGSLGVVMKSPAGKLVRWLWRRNVSEPYWASHRAQTEKVVTDQLKTRNGGGSIPDLRAEMGDKLDDYHLQNSKRFERIERKLGIEPEAA